MVCTPTIRELIQDRNRVGEIKDYIEEGRDQYGMQSFDQHLMDLVDADAVSFETAKAAASNPADFELRLKTLRRRSMAAAKVPAVAEAKKSSDESSDDVPDGFTSGGFDLTGE